MPQKWTEEERQRLRDIDKRIDKIKFAGCQEEKKRPGEQTGPHVSKAFSMTNRELQQAIIETHAMWGQTPPEDRRKIETHLNTLLDFQLARARTGASVNDR